MNLSFAQANDFKLREIHGRVTGGGSERPKVYLTRFERVEVGSLAGRDLEAVAMDLSKSRIASEATFKVRSATTSWPDAFFRSTIRRRCCGSTNRHPRCLVQRMSWLPFRFEWVKMETSSWMAF
jgi:hypothetical protein